MFIFFKKGGAINATSAIRHGTEAPDLPSSENV